MIVPNQKTLHKITRLIIYNTYPIFYVFPNQIRNVAEQNGTNQGFTIRSTKTQEKSELDIIPLLKRVSLVRSLLLKHLHPNTLDLRVSNIFHNFLYVESFEPEGL